MNRPLVSIVVAIYRSDRLHLLAAIDSALSQTWRDIEVLVGDDSPTDSLREVVASRQDPRVRYCHRMPALGVADNHWAAFREARGDYVAVLNHDDWLAPDFVATLVDSLQREPDAVLAFCDHWIIDASGCRKVAETDRNSLAWGRAQLRAGLHRPFGDLLTAQTIPMAMGTVFRRAALPDALPAEAGPAYDLWLTYLLARDGGGACYVPQRLSAWRSHPGNLTSGAGLPWLQGSAYCWQAMADDAALAGLRALTMRKAAQAHASCAARSWRDGRRLRCMRFALLSLRASVSLRGLGLLLVLPWLPVGLARRWPRGANTFPEVPT
jgi:glycosyltransferase involved in cell wall biosynthesis